MVLYCDGNEMDVSMSLVVGGGSRSGVVSACHVAGRGWCCGVPGDGDSDTGAVGCLWRVGGV